MAQPQDVIISTSQQPTTFVKSKPKMITATKTAVSKVLKSVGIAKKCSASPLPITKKVPKAVTSKSVTRSPFVRKHAKDMDIKYDKDRKYIMGSNRRIYLCSEEDCVNKSIKGGKCVFHGKKPTDDTVKYSIDQDTGRKYVMKGTKRCLLCSEGGCTSRVKKQGKCAYHFDEAPAVVVQKKEKVIIEKEGEKYTMEGNHKRRICIEKGCTKHAVSQNKCIRHCDKTKIVKRKDAIKVVKTTIVKKIVDKTKTKTRSISRVIYTQQDGRRYMMADERKKYLCSEDNCIEQAQMKGKCRKHCDHRKCATPGCDNIAHGLKCQLCESGPKPKCSTPGCEKMSQNRGRCRKCNGDQIPKCSTVGCGKCAIYKGKCRPCNGIKPPKCTTNDCSNLAFKNGQCRKCSGYIAPRCITPDCTKAGIGSSKRCSRHGGGKRCGYDECTRACMKKSEYCPPHSTHKQREIERALRRVWKRDYYERNPGARIAKNVATRIRNAIKKENLSQNYTGCTTVELKAHLEAQFVEGMCWENYGQYGWHMDHIRPVASFDLTDKKQVLKCFHYTNLQPLWWEDNLSKSSKYVPADDDDVNDE